jgi:acetyl esterase/lipase
VTATALPGEAPDCLPAADDAVDPGLRAATRFLPHTTSLKHGWPAQRVAMKAIGSWRPAPDVRIETVDRHVHVRVHRPADLDTPAPAMLWMHGGGYIMGCARQDDIFCRKIAHMCNIAVAAVEYRLAPEHPWPVPLDDCYRALRWLADQPWVDESKLMIAGASAGGGLTAALAMMARERAEVDLILQLMSYPMLDDRTAALRDPTPARRWVWGNEDNARAWQRYLGDADRDRAIPSRQADLSNLPPAWIGVGTLDVLYAESADYAQRLRDAGTPCHLEAAPGAFHAFDSIAPNAPLSLTFFASQCRAVHTEVERARSADRLC